MLAILAGYLLLLIPLTSLSATYIKEEIKPVYPCGPYTFSSISPSPISEAHFYPLKTAIVPVISRSVAI